MFFDEAYAGKTTEYLESIIQSMNNSGVQEYPNNSLSSGSDEENVRGIDISQFVPPFHDNDHNLFNTTMVPETPINEMMTPFSMPRDNIDPILSSIINDAPMTVWTPKPRSSMQIEVISSEDDEKQPSDPSTQQEEKNRSDLSTPKPQTKVDSSSPLFGLPGAPTETSSSKPLMSPLFDQHKTSSSTKYPPTPAESSEVQWKLSDVPTSYGDTKITQLSDNSNESKSSLSPMSKMSAPPPTTFPSLMNLIHTPPFTTEFEAKTTNEPANELTSEPAEEPTNNYSRLGLQCPKIAHTKPFSKHGVNINNINMSDDQVWEFNDFIRTLRAESIHDILERIKARIKRFIPFSISLKSTTFESFPEYFTGQVVDVDYNANTNRVRWKWSVLYVDHLTNVKPVFRINPTTKRKGRGYKADVLDWDSSRRPSLFTNIGGFSSTCYYLSIYHDNPYRLSPFTHMHRSLKHINVLMDAKLNKWTVFTDIFPDYIISIDKNNPSINDIARWLFLDELNVPVKTPNAFTAEYEEHGPDVFKRVMRRTSLLGIYCPVRHKRIIEREIDGSITASKIKDIMDSIKQANYKYMWVNEPSKPSGDEQIPIGRPLTREQISIDNFLVGEQVPIGHPIEEQASVDHTGKEQVPIGHPIEEQSCTDHTGNEQVPIGHPIEEQASIDPEATEEDSDSEYNPDDEMESLQRPRKRSKKNKSAPPKRRGRPPKSAQAKIRMKSQSGSRAKPQTDAQPAPKRRGRAPKTARTDAQPAPKRRGRRPKTAPAEPAPRTISTESNTIPVLPKQKKRPPKTAQARPRVGSQIAPNQIKPRQKRKAESPIVVKFRLPKRGKHDTEDLSGDLLK